ncbi:MAG: mechanosensitive ion channel [Thiothrix sp.]
MAEPKDLLESSKEDILETGDLVQNWVVDNLFSPERLIQYAVAIIGLVIAFYISRWVRSRLQLPAGEHRLKRLFFRLVRRLAFPLVLVIWTSLAILVYDNLHKGHVIIDTINDLAFAWALIRLASAFISNPTVSRSVAVLIWGIAALDILGYLSKITDWMESIKLGSGKGSLTLNDAVSSGLSVALFVWLALVAANLIERAIQNNPNLSLSSQALLAKISKFLLLTLAFLIGLNTVGIDLTAFALLGGAIGVGIGLGLQKVFSNLIAGIILLMDKSIKPGDTIVVSGRYGRVNRLSARYVSMITRDGTEHLIPNDELINNQVENWSYSDPNVRLRIPIGVHYQSDVKKAMELCIEAAQETPRVLKYPAPVCLLKGFGDNSVDLEQRIWVNDPMNGCANVKSAVMLRIWEKFRANGIEIPYPQRDLHLRSVDTAVVAQLAQSVGAVTTGSATSAPPDAGSGNAAARYKAADAAENGASAA